VFRKAFTSNKGRSTSAQAAYFEHNASFGLKLNLQVDEVRNTPN
jgi:hypothetical protein